MKESSPTLVAQPKDNRSRLAVAPPLPSPPKPSRLDEGMKPVPRVEQKPNSRERKLKGLPAFLAGDIIFCPSKGDLPGRLGRWAARARGEGPTYAVHTAQFVDAHTILEMDFVTQLRTLDKYIKGRKGFEVWRCPSLTAAQRKAVTAKALVYLNTKFGWTKLFTHALDDVINKLVRKEVFFFRRLNHSQRYPICSWITAFSYDRALHYQFGVSPECADPDQIYDWVKSHPGEWVRVFCMEEYLAQRGLTPPRP